MRKTASFGIVSVIATGIAAAIVVPGIAQSGAQSERITAKNNAPLKSAPSPQASILATVPRGSTLSLEYCNADQWCRVQFGRRTGWMATVNLNLPAGNETARLTSQARLRAGPGTQYQGLATLQAGTRVNVIRCQQQWCNVAAGYRRGWVASRMLDRGDWNNPRPPLPGPGRRSELQMFTERNCRGNTYSTLESVPNLNYPVRSARAIGGTGDPSADAWQLCVGTNYDGICTSTKTSSSCSNLEDLAGHGRLRSVRRFSEGMGGGTPTMCTQEYAPVCARSGRQDKTFSNACMAKAAGYTVRYQGQCR